MDNSGCNGLWKMDNSEDNGQWKMGNSEDNGQWEMDNGLVLESFEDQRCPVIVEPSVIVNCPLSI